MPDGRRGPTERRVSKRGGRRSSDPARGSGDVLRRAWEDRQVSDPPTDRPNQPGRDEIAGTQPEPARESDGILDQLPK
jgi:hypothetical protein